MSPISAPTGRDRRATIEWPNGQEAILSAAGWRVDPPDELLGELLNSRYGLIEIQARRDRAAASGDVPVMTFPDLLATAAKAAASATGAEVAWCDPPRAIAERSSGGRL